MVAVCDKCFGRKDQTKDPDIMVQIRRNDERPSRCGICGVVLNEYQGEDYPDLEEKEEIDIPYGFGRNPPLNSDGLPEEKGN